MGQGDAFLVQGARGAVLVDAGVKGSKTRGGLEAALGELSSVLGDRLSRSKPVLGAHGQSESHFPAMPPDVPSIEPDGGGGASGSSHTTGGPSPPGSAATARRLDVVTEITGEIEAMAGDAGSELSRGGMRTKVEAAKIARAAG